jgi:hypothetical protein
MQGTKTIAKVCGNRWSRMLCPTWAAAYLGMTLPTFRANPELAALIFDVDGKENVDREDLDAWIERKKKRIRH